MSRDIRKSIFSCLLALGLITVGATLEGCKPTYPKCESDDNCSEKGEVCVNGQCQECRDDAACVTKHGAGHECVMGRCEVTPECRSDGDCKGLVCRSKKCVPECTSNEMCPGGTKCDTQRCVPECAADVDCGGGRSCVNGACAVADTNVGAQCRPLNPSAGEVVSMPAVYFDFNEFSLTPDAQNSIRQSAECFKQAGKMTVIVEGHGDERGTQEYNLALGERRASAVSNYMKTLGINQKQMKSRSMGENQPLCSEQTEECFARNRRVQFVQQRGTM